MSMGDVEKALRKKCGLTRREATVIVSRGKRWLWLARISPWLFACFTVWRMP